MDIYHFPLIVHHSAHLRRLMVVTILYPLSISDTASRGVHFGGATTTEFIADDEYEDSDSEFGSEDVIKDANLFPYQVRLNNERRQPLAFTGKTQ